MSATIIKIHEALPDDAKATYLLAKELATSFKVEKEAFLSSYLNRHEFPGRLLAR